MTYQPDVLVSVIIPAYNRGRFIAEAIESVLAQDYPQGQIEIIVVDDGTTDGTREVVRRFEVRDQLKYIYQQNSGKAIATKSWIDAARGKYIFNLDADDKFLPDKIRTVVDIFEEDKDIIHVAHPVVYWDADNNTQRDETFPDEIRGKKISGRELTRLFLKNNKFIGGGSTFAGRGEAVKRIPISRKEIGYSIDLYMVMWCTQRGYSCYLDKPLSLYRVHHSTYSRTVAAERARLDAAANTAILEEMRNGDFEEESKRIQALKIMALQLKVKEAEGSKKFYDIAAIWSFVMGNRKMFGKEIFSIIKSYSLIQRSVPMWMLRTLGKVRG